MPLLEKDAEETLKMMANITFSLLPSTDPVIEYNATYIDTEFPNISDFTFKEYNLIFTIVNVFNLLVSLFGMVGNGTVIWILGCCMKRNPFTTYILNLSVADFGVLASTLSHIIFHFLNNFDYMNFRYVFYIFLFILFRFMFSASQFLLAVISVDRCACLYFPLWHKCNRSPYLSGRVSVVVWIFTFLISALNLPLILSSGYDDMCCYQFLLNAVLFLPAISISTIAILIKVCLMSSHHKRGKLLTVILMTLLFFLLFAFPLNVVEFLISYRIFPSLLFYMYTYIGASVNSAINPVIYFLVGRANKGRSRERINKIFEKLFQEEKYCKEDIESPIETYL